MPIIIGAKIKIKTSLLAAQPWWPFRSKCARSHEHFTLLSVRMLRALMVGIQRKKTPRMLYRVYLYIFMQCTTIIAIPFHMCVCVWEIASVGVRDVVVSFAAMYVCGASVIGPRIKVTTLQVIRDALWTCHAYAFMHTFKAYGRRGSLRNTRERTNERTTQTNARCGGWVDRLREEREDDSVNWN